MNMSESRKHNRKKVFEVCAVYTEDDAAPCVIDDVSAAGIKVSCDLPLMIGEEIGLELDDFGRVKATVRHVDGKVFGLELKLDPEDQIRYTAIIEDYEQDRV